MTFALTPRCIWVCATQQGADITPFVGIYVLEFVALSIFLYFTFF